MGTFFLIEFLLLFVERKRICICLAWESIFFFVKVWFLLFAVILGGGARGGSLFSGIGGGALPSANWKWIVENKNRTKATIALVISHMKTHLHHWGEREKTWENLFYNLTPLKSKRFSHALFWKGKCATAAVWKTKKSIASFERVFTVSSRSQIQKMILAMK